MPYLKLETNQTIPAGKTNEVLKALSAGVAKILGKPESYVMVSVESAKPMLFAGSDTPLAYLELKSLGLPESETTRLSEALCALVQEVIGIPLERVYIAFASPARHMWGWDGRTF